MAVVDRFLVDSFSGNWLKPEEIMVDPLDNVTPEYISKVKAGKTYKEAGINYIPNRYSTFNNSHWENQLQEIFQVRTFYWLIEQVCNDCSDLPLTMIELGAGGGYYSVLFSEITRFFGKKSFNVCSEIYPHKVDELIERLPVDSSRVYLGYAGNLDEGSIQEFNIDHKELTKRLKRCTISDIINENNLLRIDFLHLDIQGAELDVIQEIEEKKLFNSIRYLLISTHNDIVPGAHQYISEFLNKEGAILLDIPQPADGFACGDGFILAHNPAYGSKKLIPEKYTRFDKEFEDLPCLVGDNKFVVGLTNDKLVTPEQLGVTPEEIPEYQRIYLEPTSAFRKAHT